MRFRRTRDVPAPEPDPASPPAAPAAVEAPRLGILAFALLALQSVALAVVLSWPLVATFRTAAIGGDATDTPKHVWTLWWMRQEVVDGTPGLATAWANFPEGMELFPISPVDGLFAALLPVDPVPLSNGLALVHLVLLGLAAGWLGAEVVGTRLGAHAAAALAQGSAFAGFSLEVGVGELRLVWWIPLGLACLVRAHRTGAPRWFFALALALAGAVFSCFYHGLFLALAVSVWALVTLERRRALLLGYAGAASLALVLAVPIVRTFAGSYGDTGESGFSQDTLPRASVSVEELVTPRGHTQRGYEGGRYLGLVALALAVAGVAAGPRRAAPWVAVLATGVVLSLGPVLLWGGAPVVIGDRWFSLPMGALNAGLARVGEPVNFPARFLAPAGIALAVLGALATRWRWTALLVPVAVVDVLAGDPIDWPRKTFSLDPMEGLSMPEAGGVADLTMAMTHGEPAVRTRSIAAQLRLVRPFSAVPIERLSDWSSGADRWLRALPLVQVLGRVDGPEIADPSVSWRSDLWLLHDRGYRRILMTHRRDTTDSRADALLTRLCGEPERAAHATLWTVPVIEATEAEAKAWRAEHAQRIDVR